MGEKIALSNFTGKDITISVGHKGNEEPDYWWDIENKKKVEVDKDIFESGCFDLIQITELKPIETKK